MSGSLLFNFNVDKSTNTVLIDKAFDANRSLVWDSFTKPEILDQWWAPKPLTSKTKHMDFRVGGKRFYAMVSPEGVEIAWQRFDFTSITPQSNFTCISFFTDQEETPHSPGAAWDLTFREHATGGAAVRELTNVSISIRFESLEELESMIAMGFQEGFTVTLNELATVLQTLKH
jgi:uncharacterized protein YndB with AHSA1/START domain